MAYHGPDQQSWRLKGVTFSMSRTMWPFYCRQLFYLSFSLIMGQHKKYVSFKEIDIWPIICEIKERQQCRQSISFSLILWADTAFGHTNCLPHKIMKRNGRNGITVMDTQQKSALAHVHDIPFLYTSLFTLFYCLVMHGPD